MAASYNYKVIIDCYFELVLIFLLARVVQEKVRAARRSEIGHSGGLAPRGPNSDTNKANIPMYPAIIHQDALLSDTLWG